MYCKLFRSASSDGVCPMLLQSVLIGSRYIVVKISRVSSITAELQAVGVRFFTVTCNLLMACSSRRLQRQLQGSHKPILQSPTQHRHRQAAATAPPRTDGACNCVNEAMLMHDATPSTRTLKPLGTTAGRLNTAAVSHAAVVATATEGGSGWTAAAGATTVCTCRMASAGHCTAYDCSCWTSGRPPAARCDFSTSAGSSAADCAVATPATAPVLPAVCSPAAC